MAKEQQQSDACVLCGAHGGAHINYRDRENESIVLCHSCLQSVLKSLTREQLSDMTKNQLIRHMEVRDELAATYKNSFEATKTFCIGKKRNIPIIEVDENRGLWALPKAPMPLAQSLSSIGNIELILSSDELSDEGNADDGEELFEGVKTSDLFALARFLINKLYTSKHTDLAPIQDGNIVHYLEMVLTLDDQESGLGRIVIDLLPFWLALPSHVNAAYDCSYELISFIKKNAHKAYEKQRTLGEGFDLSACNEWLASLVTKGHMSTSDAEVVRYYLDRAPSQDDEQDLDTPIGLVMAAADTAANHVLCGQKIPEWKTQHTTGTDTFFGAFYRYAPGLSLSDVVYIMDDTGLQSGVGGMLLAQDSFAVDKFDPVLKQLDEVDQPIAYDDLLCVGTGEGKGQLVLAYKDGRRIEVDGGRYAHYIFATINYILFLRSN